MKTNDRVIHEAHRDSHTPSQYRQPHTVTVEWVGSKNDTVVVDITCGKWAYDYQVTPIK
jgi:hypothetical protein